MTGDIIPDQSNIARYCSPVNAPDGKIQATAFLLRQGEGTLSVNWLDFFELSAREDQIAEIRKVYALKKLNHRKGRIAVLNVGKVRKKVQIESQDRRNLIVRHAPSAIDASHSDICNMREDDELIAELIRETIIEEYPASL